jgi:hypothetical protein
VLLAAALLLGVGAAVRHERAGSPAALPFHFVVAPGDDPSALRLDLQHAAMVEIEASGEITVRIGATLFRQSPPHAFQMVDGHRRDVPVRFRMTVDGGIGFAVGAYDRRRSLHIASTPLTRG